jgi:hypothetical protein
MSRMIGRESLSRNPSTEAGIFEEIVAADLWDPRRRDEN